MHSLVGPQRPVRGHRLPAAGWVRAKTRAKTGGASEAPRLQDSGGRAQKEAHLQCCVLDLPFPPASPGGPFPRSRASTSPLLIAQCPLHSQQKSPVEANWKCGLELTPLPPSPPLLSLGSMSPKEGPSHPEGKPPEKVSSAV